MAQLTAIFVGRILDGKDIPSYDKCFPDIVEQETQEETMTQYEENQMLITKERLIAFMKGRNKQYKEQRKAE